jgi:hypothetical protein
VIVDPNSALAAGKGRAARIVIGRKDANLGRNRNVVSDGDAAAIIQTACFVDGAMTAHSKTPPGIEVGAAENKTFFADLDLHDRAVEKLAECVARQVTNDPVTNEKESVEPDSAQ